MKKTILVLASILSAILLFTGCNSSQEKHNASQSESDILQSEYDAETSVSEESPASNVIGNSYNATEEISETVSLEPTPEPVHLSTDEFISEIPDVIDGSVGAEDSIDNISLENGNLLICVTLGNPSPFSYEDLMLSRTSSITDAILSLENCFDLWDTITIDYGEHGSIQNGHDNIQDDGYGAYFRSENFIITTSN